MGKFFLPFLICGALLVSGCQQETVRLEPGSSQKVGREGEFAVISESIGGLTVQVSPVLIKLEDTQYLVLGLSVANESETNVVLNTNMVSVSLQREGLDTKEGMRNIHRSQLEREPSGLRTWLTTYLSPNKLKPQHNLKGILTADIVEKGTSIQRAVVPRLSETSLEIPKGVYVTSVKIKNKVFDFKFRL
jgi:hypothetical protein